MKDSIIILCGGGPAPGMNTVVCSVAKTFLSNGYRVIGLHGGYSGLFNKNPRIEDIDFFKADAYFNRGGSYLQMSRFKPTDKDFEENFTVLMGADYMGVLIEWLFQDNLMDVEILKDPETNKRFEDSLVKAIEKINDYFGK